jgi:hypothetical protein
MIVRFDLIRLLSSIMVGLGLLELLELHNGTKRPGCGIRTNEVVRKGDLGKI